MVEAGMAVILHTPTRPPVPDKKTLKLSFQDPVFTVDDFVAKAGEVLMNPSYK